MVVRHEPFLCPLSDNDEISVQRSRDSIALRYRLDDLIKVRGPSSIEMRIYHVIFTTSLAKGPSTVGASGSLCQRSVRNVPLYTACPVANTAVNKLLIPLRR